MDRLSKAQGNLNTCYQFCRENSLPLNYLKKTKKLYMKGAAIGLKPYMPLFNAPSVRNVFPSGK